jgi:hypothetical protein
MNKRGLKLNKKMAEQLVRQGLNQELLAQLKPAGSKMGNRHTVVDAITFDSALEAVRYKELKMLLQGKRIERLKVHPVFPLLVNGLVVGVYEADFRFYENGKLVVEDCKGQLTPLYILKRNLMLALYGIAIVEIKARRGRRTS